MALGVVTEEAGKGVGPAESARLRPSGLRRGKRDRSPDLQLVFRGRDRSPDLQVMFPRTSCFALRPALAGSLRVHSTPATFGS